MRRDYRRPHEQQIDPPNTINPIKGLKEYFIKIGLAPPSIVIEATENYLGEEDVVGRATYT
jgi:hypothetical protein